jgi:hypothetical protein
VTTISQPKKSLSPSVNSSSRLMAPMIAAVGVPLLPMQREPSAERAELDSAGPPPKDALPSVASRTDGGGARGCARHSGAQRARAAN